MSFFNPVLALGALLFAVPLIIHLLNRRRYRRHAWAAMDLLLAAYRKTRRRLRLESLLLLLLRCAVPVVLALAVARPVLDRAGLLATGDGPRHHVMVLDASYSMGYQPPGADSPFERARSMGLRLLDSVEQAAGLQKVSIVEAGVATRAVLSAEANVERARNAWNELSRPSDGARDLAEGLALAADLAAAEVEPARIYVFTDMQERAFGPVPEAEDEQAPATTPPDAREGREEDAPPPDSLRELLLALRELGGEVVFLDLRPTPPTENLQVVSLSLEEATALARREIYFAARVANHSQERRIAEVVFEVDGQPQARERVEVEPGGATDAVFSTSFAAEGFRSLSARLAGDALAADDERHLVVRVRDRIRVLLVEGSDERDETLTETFLLRNLLDPTHGEGDAAITVFAPTVIDWIQWHRGREDLNDYDLVVLCNVDRVTEEAGRRLDSWVRAGGALWVILGDRAQADTYNLHLHGLDGRGPLPLRLREPRGHDFGSPVPFTAEILDPDHPVLADFRDGEARALFEVWPIYRFFASEAPGTGREEEQGSDRVLVRLREEGGTPLLAARDHGAGRCLVLTTTLNRRPDRWNRLDHLYIALPLIHQAVRWLTMPVLDAHNVLVGSALTAVTRERPGEVSVVLPAQAGGGKRAVGGRAQPLEEGRWQLPAFTETVRAGAYRMEAEVERAGTWTEDWFLFAVNVDPAEGVLDYVSVEDLKERLPMAEIATDLPRDVVRAGEAARGEVGPRLLLLLLAFLLAEGLLARFVGWRRR